MDWTAVISRNRGLLVAIVAALAAMVAGRAVLPRRVYQAVMLVLRPAEAAVRRLIVIVARDLVLKPSPARPFPVGLHLAGGAGAARGAVFGLIDPLKRFGPDIWNAEADEDADAAGGLPRISVPGLFDPVFAAPSPLLSPDDPVSAAAMLNRLNALQRALAHLPREARRLARWQARQEAARRARSGPWKPLRLSPLRPGLPPGHRDRHRHDVDAVLGDCHHFAREALKRGIG